MNHPSRAVYHFSVLRPRMRRFFPFVLILTAGLLADCTSGSNGATGSVNVSYPVSFQGTVAALKGPARAQGITIFGTSSRTVGSQGDSGNGGSVDVVVSDGPADADLGKQLTWSVTFASTPLVLAYERADQWAAKLRSQPWFQVVDNPGFRLGRGDPHSDEAGTIATSVLSDVALQHGESSLLAELSTASNIYSNSTLIRLLRSGKLSGALMLGNEARSAHLSMVPLGVPSDIDSFTVSIPENAPDPRAAAVLVGFLLSQKGGAVIARSGITRLNRFTISGNWNKVPASVKESLR